MYSLREEGPKSIKELSPVDGGKKGLKKRPMLNGIAQVVTSGRNAGADGTEQGDTFNSSTLQSLAASALWFWLWSQR